MREQRRQQRCVSFFLLSNMDESHLKFSQLQLHHVLTQGLNKHSREELGVGFHLKQRPSGLTGAPCQSHSQPKSIFSYLVERVYLLSVGCKGHEPRRQVDQAADHHVLLAEAGLMITHEVTAPHHIAVTVLHAAVNSRYNTFILYFLGFFWRRGL